MVHDGSAGDRSSSGSSSEESVTAAAAASRTSTATKGSSQHSKEKRQYPDWSHPDQVVAAFREQACIDVSSIFGPQEQRTIDLTDCFQYEVQENRKRKRGPCGDDFNVVIVAGEDLPRRNEASKPLAAGFRYEVIMSGVDTFKNLCRHFAKHNNLRAEDLVFKCSREGPSLNPADTPFTLGAILDLTLHVYPVVRIP